MSRKTVHVSDLTGKVIDDPNQVAELRILAHPLIDHAVKLDAFLLEVQKLHGTSRDLVTLELVVPGNDPETLLLEVAEFDKLFKAGTAGDALDSAEPYYGGPKRPEEMPRRRGRPPGATNVRAAPKVKRDPVQLNAIREWWRGQGNEIGDRGRIPQSVEAAYEEFHKAS